MLHPRSSITIALGIALAYVLPSQAFEMLNSQKRCMAPQELETNSLLMETQDSNYCLGCHDGSVATDQSGTAWSFTTGEHPVEIDYDMAFYRRPGDFRSPSQVESQLRLPRGQVHCQSCHDLSSDNPAKLGMNNFGSQLCLSCHIK